jgi:hypothetical protein
LIPLANPTFGGNELKYVADALIGAMKAYLAKADLA